MLGIIGIILLGFQMGRRPLKVWCLFFFLALKAVFEVK